MKYFKYYQVKDVMTPDPITVGPDITLADVHNIFEEKNFEGVPIVDSNKRYLGIITKLDILKACVFRKTSWFPAILSQKTYEVMNKGLNSVHPGTPLMEVLEKMVETDVKSFPVVEDDRLIGIIAQEDILKALRKASLGVIPARLISTELKGLIEPTNIKKTH